MCLLHRRTGRASQTRQRTPTHNAPFGSLCEYRAYPLLLNTLCLYCTDALAEPAKPASACPLTARRLARSASSAHVRCCLRTLCVYCTDALAEPAKPASACPLTARRAARSASSAHVQCCLARYASTAPAHWQSQPNSPTHASAIAKM